MNAEIYFPREGYSLEASKTESFDNAVKKLAELDVQVMYKTEISIFGESISSALHVSAEGDDKIEMILIADVLNSDSKDEATAFFKTIGITKKINRLSAVYKTETEEVTAAVNTEGMTEREKKKALKKAEKETRKSQKEIADGKTLYAYSGMLGNTKVVLFPKYDEKEIDFANLLLTIVDGGILHQQSQKIAFWRRIIPCSGDRATDVVRKIIAMLAICTFLVSSYMLVYMTIVEPTVQDNKSSTIRDLLVSTDEQSGGSSSGSQGSGSSNGSEDSTPKTVLADFERLLSTNSDTVGWIQVPNTMIDYVVVQPQNGKDKEYYLYRDFFGDYSKYGTLFVDYRSSIESQNIIIHGHHMQDGRMFANLLYFQSLDFYKGTPTFTFNSIYEKSTWKIISVYKTNTEESQGEIFNYFRGDFASDSDFLNYVYQVRMRSIINCPVDVNEDDTLITLSTCAYDFDGFRFIVVARKVRDGESESVDTSQATWNNNPLYPDIWYQTNGGTAPTVTSFEQAYGSGELWWYENPNNVDWNYDAAAAAEQSLKNAKNNAIDRLAGTIAESSYRSSEQAEVDALYTEYTEAINAAETNERVLALYEEAMQKLRNIKTDQQLTEEESRAASQQAEESRLAEESRAAEASQAAEESRKLEEARTSGKAEIDSISTTGNYTGTQQQKFTELKQYYKNLIDGASSASQITEYVNGCKSEISYYMGIYDEENQKSSEPIEESSESAAESSAEEPSMEESGESAEPTEE